LEFEITYVYYSSGVAVKIVDGEFAWDINNSLLKE
jgi:hypothetical protein